METSLKTIPIFIGYDYRERAAANVLIDSLYQNSTLPLSITPLVTNQLKKQGLYWREKDPKQSTEFSFTRFLVPYLMNYKDWAIFMDCDMLCKSDICELINFFNDKYALLCVKHNHIPKESFKFQGEPQSSYPRKNWSSFMVFNCTKCKSLTPEYVNESSGLDLHRFNWLKDDNLIGEISMKWNYLVGIEEKIYLEKNPKIIHWTLGGPWFKNQRLKGDKFAAEWFSARDASIRLWD